MQRETFVDWVDPYIGTIGHLLTATRPLIHLPHGMAQVMPMLNPTITDRFTADIIYGFPMNHATLMVDSGENPRFTSQYDHDLEEVKCYLGRVFLEDSDIQAEYTVTQHCALYCFQFPACKAWVQMKVLEDGKLDEQDNYLFTGYQQYHGVKCYFAAQMSLKPVAVSKQSNEILLQFENGAQLQVAVGFSYIDESQAVFNMKTELADKSLEQVAEKAKEVWNNTLGQIEVDGGTVQQKRIFYTALYRVHQRMINITEHGRYYSSFDHQIHQDSRDFYVDDGIWDTYRGAHPLQLLLDPRRQMDIIYSYLRIYQQTGWLPSFPHLDGSLNIMIGKHAAAMLTDTWMKGYHDFDIELAYEAMIKNADQATKLPWTGGEATEFDKCYLEKGFFPALSEGEEEHIQESHPFERRQCVSVTLECCYDDWCISQLANALDKKDDAARFAKRATNYRTVFNPETGFMSPRTEDGNWVPNFNPKLSGGLGGRAYFAECNAWIYTMHVQHDVQGLAELFGGRNRLAERLDNLFREQYGTSKYAFLGQFPDSTGLIGQYCMGNEPSFHIPYMYNQLGQAYKTQRKLREIMKLWYTDTPLGICGDEDGGAMSAWYVFSAMGFYPFCPGRPEYQIGSPLFDEVRIHVDGGKTFTIKVENQSEINKYIQSAQLNGQDFNSVVLQHNAIVNGSTLVFHMGSRPNVTWGQEKS